MASEQITPLKVDANLEEPDDGVENRPFRELVGSPMLLSTSTRPDSSNAGLTSLRGYSARNTVH